MKLFRKKSADNTFSSTIKGLIGASPKNLELYKLAVRHSSGAGDSNERLEYLGDAILGSVIAEFLFLKFPFKDEGFLTEIRSRIVKRDSLNALAKKIGLDKLVSASNENLKIRSSSIYGNALEAMVGAVYLDKGYKFTGKFIMDMLVHPHIDLEQTIELNSNFKSQLIEWAQKNEKAVRFDIVNELGAHHDRTFVAAVILDDKEIVTCEGQNKKRAEQGAAEKALELLGLSK